MLKEIEQDNIVLGIVRGDTYWKSNKVLLNREYLRIISKDPIDLPSLPKEPRIVFNTDPKLLQMMDSWWYSNYSQLPAINMEIDNIETSTKLVSRWLGYAIATLNIGENRFFPHSDPNMIKMLADTKLNL